MEADISRYKPGGGLRGSFGYDRCLIVIVFVVAGASRGFGETRLHEVVLRGIRPRADPVDRFLNEGGTPIDAPLVSAKEDPETSTPGGKTPVFKGKLTTQLSIRPWTGRVRLPGTDRAWR